MENHLPPKTMSCGIILTDGQKLLLCHVPNTDRWDLPKGTHEQGEFYTQTALRELQEETGVRLDYPKNLIPLPKIPYMKTKNLRLFLYLTKKLPKIEQMQCSSMVTLPDRPPFPEADAWQYVAFENLDRYVFPNMLRVLQELEPVIHEYVQQYFH